MKSLKNFKRLLINCLSRSDAGVVDLIKKYSSTNGYTLIQEALFCVAVPTLGVDALSMRMPLVCAHYDTVRHEDECRVISDGDLLMNAKKDALGGDDRCGVAIALALMQEHTNAIFCFFDEEETGCGGSSQFIKMYPNMIRSSSCYIGLDRAHNLDAAVYSHRSEKLLGIVAKYGYKEVWGSLTDVSNIEDTYPKALVNLSVGFNNQHTEKETVNLKHAYYTYASMRDIVPQVTGNIFDDIEVADHYSYIDYSYNGRTDGHAHWNPNTRSYGRGYEEEDYDEEEYYESYSFRRGREAEDDNGKTRAAFRQEALPFGASGDLSHMAQMESLIVKGTPAYREIVKFCEGCPSFRDDVCEDCWECFSQDDIDYLETANSYFEEEEDK